MIITYAGEEWAALRDDQKVYVQHCMLSWRAHYGEGGWYSRFVLARAIKKAREQLP